MDHLNSFYSKERWKFRVVFHGVGALVFMVLIFHPDSIQIPVPRKPYPVLSGQIGVLSSGDSTICTGIYEYDDYDSKCTYLKANPGCDSGGFLNYIKFFYCDLGMNSALRHLILVIWLVTLFYLLGNTAADYFCSCLEKLSSLLNLSPTLAGVTLLPLGNGAPDVFSSVAAFVGPGSGGVGLNGVLGGAVFVTSVVVGTVCLCVAEREVRIDKKCFVRDISFFLFSSFSLLLLLVLGEVSVGGAVAFLSIYLVYAASVAAVELLRRHAARFKFDSVAPLLPLKHEDDSLWEVPKVDADESLWGWNDRDEITVTPSCSGSLLKLVQAPLMLPRRLTIPIVDPHRWSKTYAVSSAFSAPLLLALLWNARYGYVEGGAVYIVGAVVGGVLGIIAFMYTSPDRPPETFLFPWISGGFLMSIVWFYILANELVALFVAFGVIFGINPSLLALTVLAWGNSLGDLISNVAMAMKSKDGVQIAISGCYAGPMFNTLVGLGLSLVIGACSGGPSSYTISRDPSLFYTLGFLVGALVFALVVLLWNDMRPNRFLGFGLMTMYLAFLFVRASLAMGDGSVTLGPS